MNTFIRMLVSALAALLAIHAYAATDVTALRIQNAEHPIAVEDRHPVFSWRMVSDERGQHQTAYRISVTRDSDGSLLWDTGKVESGISVGIPYQGVALQPEMTYSAKVEVWDRDGAVHEVSSSFETSLMSPRKKAWGGAEWIGTKKLKLDAASQVLYTVRTDFDIVKGSTASLIIGADDFRMQSRLFNADGVEGKHYVQVELDLSGRDTEDGASLKIYRVGYKKTDSASKPMIEVSRATYPETNINDILIPGTKHSLEVRVNASEASFYIDGKGLTGPRNRVGFFPGMDFSVGMTGTETGQASSFPIGSVGNGNNYPSFPNLCSVGFAAGPESEVVYTVYEILNDGQSEDRKVFGEEGYGIFSGLPGVDVNGGEIRVTNHGKTTIRGWADPSHGAETMLRSEFEITREISSARLYASAMGIYNFYINGSRVGDVWFAPGGSQYRETMGYHKYDVTDLLRNGRNAIGAQLSGGWYTGYMTFTPGNFNFFGDYEALISRLVISYTDGTREVLVSNPWDWKVYTDGPIRLGSFFQGERYDAGKEAAVKGWSEPGYDDSGWKQAETIDLREWVDFDFQARYDEPVRLRETLTAQEIMPTHSMDGHTYIYNMGVNMVGVPSITIPAGWLKEGDTVVMAYGEQLYPGLKGDSREYIRRFGKKGRDIAGQILFETNRAALNLDFYTASGSGEVTIQPSMTFRGYQYIQIYLPSHTGPLPLENVKGLVLSSCEVPTGTYHATTSDGRTGELVNGLFRNIQRSQLGNFFTIPTDCPQRNERMGWTGDAQAYTRTGTYNADIQNFLRQWMVALRADQGIGDDKEVPGGIGSTVPTYNKSDDRTFANGTTWAAAVCQVPWQLYIQYGDTQIIEENLETMMDWLNGMAFYKMSEEFPHLSSKASGLADHLAMDSRTPADLLNNAIYIYMMDVTARMAEVVGRDDYAQILRARHTLAKAEWNRAYVNPLNGKTRSLKGSTVHTQASYATPLNFNVFNDEYQARAAAWLAELAARPAGSGPSPEEIDGNAEEIRRINESQGVLSSGNTDMNFRPWTITTGFSGTPNILPSLSRNGYNEEAYRMISSTDYVSWLYPVTEGATSMWERWNSYDNAFSEPNNNSMNSFNHFALGAVAQWMYEYQLGITTDYASGCAGYKEFILQPSAGGLYTALEGSYESNYGTISSAWTADGKGMMTSYRCTIPANTSATLYLPIEAGVESFGADDGATFQGVENRNGQRTAVYHLASGSYTFTMNHTSVFF